MWYEAKIINALEAVEPNILFILADRNGVEPSPPYCLVTTFPISKIGSSVKSFVEKENKQTINQTTQIIFRLTLHAEANSEAHNVFESLHCGLESDFYIYQFLKEGFGITNISELTYTSAPVDGTVQYKRATFDLTMLSSRIEEFYSDRISHVNTLGTLTSSVNKGALSGGYDIWATNGSTSLGWDDNQNVTSEVVQETTINISVSGNYED